MSTRTKVLHILSDGAFHSGTDIGDVLGISRAAVNKSIKSLVQLGLQIHRVTGRGYRLAQDCSPLREKAIRQSLQVPGTVIHILDEVDSTNEYLLRLAQQVPVTGQVCLSESQRQGRGRRGRAWMATPYSNIILSMAWKFEQGAAVLSGLSLAAGVAIAQAIEQIGVNGVGLKWPNDVLWTATDGPGSEARKLGGILVDIHGEASGPCLVVVGVGINVALQHKQAQGIDQPWIDLNTIATRAVDRNHLAGLIIGHLDVMFRRFEAEGFAVFRQQWQARHLYAGKPVRLLMGEHEYYGEVEGVDTHGALLLRDASGERRVFHSGEVSLRLLS